MTAWRRGSSAKRDGKGATTAAGSSRASLASSIAEAASSVPSAPPGCGIAAPRRTGSPVGSASLASVWARSVGGIGNATAAPLPDAKPSMPARRRVSTR